MDDLAVTLRALTFLDLVVMGLAAYRVTRFLVVDTMIGKYPDEQHPRGTGFRAALDRFAYADDDGEVERSWLRAKIAELLSCPWCLGWHVSWGVLIAYIYGPAWLVAGLWVFAIAGAQGFVQSRLNA